jgi:putative membrane protein
MKWVFRIVAVLLFIVFFGFAVRNTQEVDLNFFPAGGLHGPMVLMLLSFFVAGAVLGVIAMMPTLFRHRRDLGRQRKELALVRQEREAEILARAQAPRPDGSGSI